MDNLIYLLCTALVANINANVNIIARGALVEFGRIRPYDSGELPAIAVFYVSDSTVGENGPQNSNFMDWNVQVSIELSIDADATVLPGGFQQELLNFRADVYAALMSLAPTQGLDFVSFTAPHGADEPALDDRGKLKTAGYRTNWVFRVRTAIDDMTT